MTDEIHNLQQAAMMNKLSEMHNCLFICCLLTQTHMPYHHIIWKMNTRDQVASPMTNSSLCSWKALDSAWCIQKFAAVFASLQTELLSTLPSAERVSKCGARRWGRGIREP